MSELFKEIDLLHKSLGFLAEHLRNTRDQEELQILTALSKLARTRILDILKELEKLL